ncbi:MULTISPECIES: phage tail domain-containing protein [Bacillus cereus group]|uniref:phage tail domain-containing protein n=1 Tax=Bacillus cereus group TaxID=86661 RepID=UPI000200EA25|nr:MULTISPECIES: phage tail domain-containing protein [Bacillus cereus group]ADY24085.1 Gp13 protein [Bacillus thuringiensis serovar finitimus YBT-020]OTX67101.1 phage tail protein [Bacillus thuringiensis serovar finitimus]MCR6800387.1 phage tail family protein [Bacillus paranthracis]MEC3016425.1 phage tail family protein [Bacillus cereus]MEC3256384.1 phage tail family protein [Bacillus cereus]
MLDIGIDNELASSYGLGLVGRPVIPTAKQKVEHIEIPGRHGSLTKKGAYENVPFKVKFNMLERENIKPFIRRAKPWLLQGRTLFFTDDDVYRKIKHVEMGDIITEIEEHGEFEVDFTLDPFEYTEDINLKLTNPGVIYNPGTIESDPKFWIVGNGTFRITINDVSFQIKDVNGSVVIDSEVLEAYTDTISMNNKMVGQFPIFNVGENTIEWSGAIQFMEIRPRWRYK